MRTLYYPFIAIMLVTTMLTAQSVTGKLVDINGTGLVGLTVKLYISPDYKIAYTSSDGTFTIDNVTGIENDPLPTGYFISNNYPNPFNPKTRINITLPYKSNVKIDVFNILGQNVGRGIDKTFGPGNNYVDLELNGLPNGVYAARINVEGKYIVTKKMMLVYGSPHLSTAVNYSSINIKNSIAAKMLDNITIDSIVVKGTSIKKNIFTDLPQITGSILDLGNLIVNTTTTGIPCIGTPTITYAGKTYNTVKIGTQCWLKENLNVGKMIDSTANATNNNIIEKYCYKNDSSYCAIYGGLYQWAEAVQYQNSATNTSAANPAFSGNIKGICPNGWHIPTDDEFGVLESFVGNNGDAIKAVGQGSGTNTSGFSALFGGARGYGGFYSFGMYAYFISSTEYFPLDDPRYEVIMYVFGTDSSTHNDMTGKAGGANIRCLKN